MIQELFGGDRAVVGMVHVQALPGTPYSRLPVARVIQEAVEEARRLGDAGFDGLIIENMHDRPYLRQAVGPEIVAAMSAVGDAIRSAVEIPLGVQILGGANREALAVALAAGGSFIRAENFVYAHVADEGLMADAEAGPLLRYRRELDAEHIRVFADIKKKHAAHAVTADVELADAAKTARLFGADALVITGRATGEPTLLADVREVGAAVEMPIAVGSGLTPETLAGLWEAADVFVVGSFLKQEGLWFNPLDPDRIDVFMRAVDRLRGG